MKYFPYKIYFCVLFSCVFIFSVMLPVYGSSLDEISYSIEFTNLKTAAEAKNKKEVYLTFDDGPYVYTPEILDILDSYKVPATFFVVGDTEYTDYMPEIKKRGHAIGLHSYDHKFEKIYKSPDAYFADLKKIDEIVYEKTGISSKILRFPGGSSVKRGSSRAKMNQLCKLVQEKGYQYFDWNCESGDKAGVSTVSRALSRVRSTAAECDDTIIVLMHDTEKVTVNSLPGIIEYFRDQGCQFKSLEASSPAVHHSW